TGGGRAYGRPQDFSGTQPVLYRNLGEGRFEEATTSVGLEVLNPATGRPMAKSLGVTFGDFNGDRRPDIFVSNDTVQNFLFVSTPGGGFEEQAILTGVAFDQNGRARGAMGLDLTRFRGGDSLGIAIGNFASEMTALYVSQPEAMQFTDEAVPSGLGPQTRLALTFGVCFLDVDLDGREDLLTANGHLEEEIHRVQPAQHYEQPPQLFWNAGEAAATEFRLLTAEQTGNEFAKPLVGRGAAFADIDADGDQDMLIMTAGGRPRLLRNDTDHGHHWIRFQLEGTQSNRDAIGAMVELKTAAGLQYRQVMPTRSYLSQVELPVTFGLGTAEVVEQVTIRWPRGAVTTLEQPAIDTQHTVREPVEQTAGEQGG
ncbi:MAG: CRTAC1 family protein, partial [Planctomycetaceae bacterium]|nr:CRTAC1 family protein [Planctomycetaceae bacterium]